MRCMSPWRRSPAWTARSAVPSPTQVASVHGPVIEALEAGTSLSSVEAVWFWPASSCPHADPGAGPGLLIA